MDKNTEIQRLSETILSDFELSQISFEKILMKIKKLARLKEDYDTIIWIDLEINGYKDRRSIPDFPKGINCFTYAKRSGRSVYVKDEKTEKEVEKFWTASICELEAGIASAKISLESIQTPQNFTPAITTYSTGGSHVQEKFKDVLDKIAAQKREYSNTISENGLLLSKIKSNFYNYVLNVYLQSTFDGITESLFQKTKDAVDKKLQNICPGVIKKLVAAYNRVNSCNDEELSQAMSSCRNALKEFADAIFPAKEEKFKRKNGTEIAVTDDKYKNRLIAFIEEHEKKTNKEYLQARVDDLVTRVHSLNDLLSKGTHVGIDAEFVNICIIDTYLIIGSMIGYLDAPIQS